MAGGLVPAVKFGGSVTCTQNLKPSGRETSISLRGAFVISGE
jgi:hypothetical protein